MNIDWSEGKDATHYDNRAGAQPAFMRKNHNGRDWEFLGRDGHWIMYGPIQDNMVKGLIERPAPWTGEGPPPVGTVCEVDGGPGESGWGKCTILYSSSDVVVFKRDAYVFESSAPVGENSFRPVRTREQIAAEAKLEAAKALYCTINWNNGAEQWARLSDSRKSDYLKAIEAGWGKVLRA